MSTAKLISIISGFQGKSVLVFGDMMLDEWVLTLPSKLSPEAPVPIVVTKDSIRLPGGCGNVAANVASMGGLPVLVSVRGDDSDGHELWATLSNRGVGCENVVVEPYRQTVKKTRIVAGLQHIVRIDLGGWKALSHSTIMAIEKKLTNTIPKVDLVVISDYGKGVVTEKFAGLVTSLAKKHGKQVVVDPKNGNYGRHSSVTLLKPNKLEASLASGVDIEDDASLTEAGKRLLVSTGAKHVLITCGKDGMTLFSGCGDITKIPTIDCVARDITGAGDTATAAIALSLAAGADMKNSAILANAAASVVVGKSLTAVCSKQELESVVGKKPAAAEKIVSTQSLAEIVKKAKYSGLEIAFTNGCFDILHLGHVRYLARAKDLADLLIVGINSDKSVRALKGEPRPYVDELCRAEIIASLACVDYVVVFDSQGPDDLLRLIRPDYHAKGGDYSPSQLPELALTLDLGCSLVLLPVTKRCSTTEIVEKILKNPPENH